MQSRDGDRSSAIKARAKVWLEADGKYVFGLGISKILRAVDQEGSIKAAANVVGKSYRHIWARIKEAEEAFEDRDGRYVVIPAPDLPTGPEDTFARFRIREVVTATAAKRV